MDDGVHRRWSSDDGGGEVLKIDDELRRWKEAKGT